MQVSVNFLMCRRFVFPTGTERPISRQYAEFLAGIGTFRLVDWAAYSIVVEFLGVPFLVAQVVNVVVFSLLKFRFSEKVFRARDTHSSQNT
jgi:putative flippase GtrA